MLAQNFKTPADLDATDKEFGALTKLLGMLERGEIKPPQFSMKDWDSDCGTVHCIGGWARHIAGTASFRGWPWKNHELFYPGFYKIENNYVCGYGATVDQAAIALRNFLTHGEPRWAEALG